MEDRFNWKNFLQERKYQIAFMEARAFLEQELKSINNTLHKFLEEDRDTDYLFKKQQYLKQLISKLERIEKDNDLELPSINEEELD